MVKHQNFACWALQGKLSRTNCFSSTKKKSALLLNPSSNTYHGREETEDVLKTQTIAQRLYSKKEN
jgi:hypothetical protein